MSLSSTQPCAGHCAAPAPSDPQMNNVHCPVCGEECFNTWGLIEHTNRFHAKRSPEDTVQLLAATWEEVQQVLAEAEAILAGLCPCCGSNRVLRASQNGITLYFCLDCKHEWEG